MLGVCWLVGRGFPQLCTAALTNQRLYEPISLTNTHCLNRKDGWENGKVRAVSPASLHRKYRTATDLGLTLSPTTHTHTHTHAQTNTHAYVNTKTHTYDDEQEEKPHKHHHHGLSKQT